MDNLKIKIQKNEIIIKKGIIQRKNLIIFRFLCFPIIPLIYGIINNLEKINRSIMNIFGYIIVVMYICAFLIIVAGTYFYELSLEQIKIIKDKKLIIIIGDGISLKVFSKDRIEIKISQTKEHFYFTRASFKEMCTMTFIINDEKKYKWGFRLSDKKAEEIKKILENMEVEFNA